VLLANLIHFTRQFFHNFLTANWEGFPLLGILRWLRPNHNVQGTLPGLQHDFCSLRNEIVQQTRDRDHCHALHDLLREIISIHVGLHQGSTPYDQHQLCSIPSHRIDSASNLNEVDGGIIEERVRAPITTSPALLFHDTVPPVIPPIAEYHAPPSHTSNLDHAIPRLVDEQLRNGVLDNITPVTSSFHPAPLENDQLPDGTAADPIQETTDPSAMSSMVNTDSRSTSNRGTTSRPTRNMITATPSIIPDTVPPPIPLLTVSPGPPAPHISADPTVNQSDHSPDDGPLSLSSSQIFTSFPLTPQVVSGFDSNTTTEIGLFDGPEDTLDPNLRAMSQSFTPSSPDVAESSLRPEDGDDPSETSGPSH